eukprot:COSAG03_NODE_20458_length_319_cov_0.650000_1_plen_88_part_10
MQCNCAAAGASSLNGAAPAARYHIVNFRGEPCRLSLQACRHEGPRAGPRRAIARRGAAWAYYSYSEYTACYVHRRIRRRAFERAPRAE